MVDEGSTPEVLFGSEGYVSKRLCPLAWELCINAVQWLNENGLSFLMVHISAVKRDTGGRTYQPSWSVVTVTHTVPK